VARPRGLIGQPEQAQQQAGDLMLQQILKTHLADKRVIVAHSDALVGQPLTKPRPEVGAAC